MSLQHFQLMSEYNRWMNQRLFAAAGSLEREQLTQDRGAFFPSILHTLNHIAVGDTLWLKRFATHPDFGYLHEQSSTLASPKSLDELLFTELDDLRAYREQLDQIIAKWVASIAPESLRLPLAYRNMAGLPFCKNTGLLISHFFNHQTHHRGQLSTLLFQAGVDIGLTDLLGVIPDSEN